MLLAQLRWLIGHLHNRNKLLSDEVTFFSYYCLLLYWDLYFFWGSLGYVAINNFDSAWDASFSTSLPDGKYCDVISGTGSSGKCTGTTCVILTVRCWISFFDVSASVSPCLMVHSPVQYPLEALSLFIQLRREANLLLSPSNKLVQLNILDPS